VRIFSDFSLGSSGIIQGENDMKLRQAYFSGLMILFLLAGCTQAADQNPAEPQSTDVPAEILTPIVNATETPTQTISPIPPPTRRATITSIPSNTPLPSFTRVPTSKNTKTVTATITGTNTLYVRPPNFGGPTFSATPIPYKCEETDVYPEWGQVFTQRSDFVAKWKIMNTGANMWHEGDIFFGYVSGTKMQNDEQLGKILNYTIYAKDTIRVQLHIKPPQEPGFYTTIFGFRKTNKKEFFCTFSVTIQVVKK
jgi:hypothetical protein